jgi:hypothetical protein
MAHFQIRYNQTRGQPGRGTVDHVWRVFEDGKEYLTKNVEINVPCRGAKTGGDYGAWSVREHCAWTVRHLLL